MYSSSRRAERAGFVEVIGRGDGLWAWFGTDFATAGDCLAAATTVLRPACSAAVYRQALSLLIAQRRPSEYLLGGRQALAQLVDRSEEHTSELQSLMRISYAVFCLKKKKKKN